MICRKLEHAMLRTFIGSVILFPPTLVIILPQQPVLSEGLQRQWRIPRSKKDVNLNSLRRICAETMRRELDAGDGGESGKERMIQIIWGYSGVQQDSKI